MSGVASKRVFVYGTLRRDARGPLQNELTRGWSFEGFGSVAAELFDFGPYPGALAAADGASRMRGEVYRLPMSSETLDALDRHEGEDFQRALVDVSLEGGGEARAWIYWYRGEERGRRVASGDYVAHRQRGVARG